MKQQSGRRRLVRPPPLLSIQTSLSLALRLCRTTWRTLRKLRATSLSAERFTTFPDFAALAVVEGNLTIDNITTGGLPLLSGIFPALDSVYGTLTIQNQSVVATIAGFVALDTIGGGLSINNNTPLTSIPDFGALTDIGGNLFIADNANLVTFSGFGALETITGSLNIGNPDDFNWECCLNDLTYLFFAGDH